MIPYLIESILLGCVLLLMRPYLRRQRYPPGPKPLPIVGNILDMPRFYPWETVMRWGETYGDMIYVKNFSDRTVFINSYDLANELLDKRGAMYSSRPRMVMCNELQGWGYVLSAMPYCEDHRRGRQILHRFLQPSTVGQYNPILTKEVHKCLLKVLQTPEQFFRHMKHLSGATIMEITYGYEAKSEKDPYIDLAEKAMAAITGSLNFFVVNYVPMLKYLPDWFPGAGFKQFAKAGRKLATDLYNLPYAMGKDHALSGQSLPSIISDILGENINKLGEAEDEEIIKTVTSTTYVAGVESSASSVVSFILAMVLYPEVQQRAQEEIDQVVGKGNLPTFSDLDNLPYVTAIYYETLRWHPIGPFAVPHCTTEDDVYGGYSIPANTTVIANVWAMTRDPKEYPEPDLFKPERFLQKEDATLPRNPDLYIFGFGRRICPGRHLAENIIKLTIASCLAAFNIDKAIGEDGLPITPTEDYTSSIASLPKPFKCKITPRFRDLEALLSHLTDAAK